MSDGESSTIFGWDASHHDWGRGSMDIAAAVRAGIVFMTHKIGEAGSFTDDKYDDFYVRAKAAGVKLLGAYYVNHPGDQVRQADRFLSLLDRYAAGWRDGPFILQVDAEKFDYMDRAPNLTEIRAFCDRLVDRTGGRFRPIVYAPKWLYGDKLKGLPYPLWASNYGSNPTGAYRGLYPGDGSSRWVAYSGQVPAILQYGSRTTIGTQKTCDANAFRGRLSELVALVTGDDMALSDADAKALVHRVNTMIDMADTNPYGDGLKPEPNKLAAAIKSTQLAAVTAEQHSQVIVANVLNLVEKTSALLDEVQELKARPVVEISDEQLERVVRKVLGGVDGATPEQG